MKFKLNAFEKLWSRNLNKIIIVFIVFSALCIGLVLVSSQALGTLVHIVYRTVGVILMIITTLTGSSVAIKSIKASNTYSYQLQPQKYLEFLVSYLEATKPSQKFSRQSFYIDRITMLWMMGEYNQAEYELSCFVNTYDASKVNELYKTMIHSRWVELSLVKGDYNTCNEQIKVLYSIVNEYKGSKAVKNILNNIYIQTILFADAFTANENSNENEFEARAFTDLNTPLNKAKPAKKKIKPIEYVNTYYKLFLFYRNKGNIEKTKYYAIQIASIGNMQLKAYRDVKEFLDNENRSN